MNTLFEAATPVSADILVKSVVSNYVRSEMRNA